VSRNGSSLFAQISIENGNGFSSITGVDILIHKYLTQHTKVVLKHQ
jgi:hypothetical protein